MKKIGDYYVSESPLERAFLVGLHVRGTNPLLSVEDSLEELAKLADTAGMEVVEQASQTLNSIDPTTFIGSGKVAEITESIEHLNIQTVVFDDELTPRHQRELEKRFGSDVKVLDRSALILDIFAQHARTREGSLQVELAQYEYRLPRLTRQWTHLARQAGGGGSRSGNAGVGLRGPGETQLEVDRREISRKITKLKQDLELVRNHRLQHRTNRRKAGVPVIALVGYTNAGKSTLLRTLTGANAYAADQLFATLDPLTRQINLPNGRGVLLTDTVGFIQKLPTALIASFRATLEEISAANLFLHVVDLSHPHVLQQVEAVEDTLAELDVPAIPRILVWNKIDRLAINTEVPEVDLTEYTDSVSVSASTGENMTRLLTSIECALSEQMHSLQVMIPYERGEIVAQLFDTSNVLSQKHTENGVLIKANVPNILYNALQEYIIDE